MALIKQQQPGKGMWPFQTMSLPIATVWADAASLVLLACVICAAVATFVLVQTAKVKEQRWSEAASQAQQQVAALQRELGSARTANEANGRAAAAKDEVAKAKGTGAPVGAAPAQPASTDARAEPPKLPGRALTDEQVQALARRMAPFTHQHITVGASPVTLESGRFADQLVIALRAAGVSAERSDSSAGIQIGPAHGVVARYVTGNQRSEQFAKSLTEELAADGITARAMNGLVEEIMQALVKQGRPINDPANEWVVVAIGD
ncbi:MAG: hypothetical protein JO289_07790 [Xanthobacteraceae bacterium]|nr:hypothetical protein [Xanthobacteraceae bacterium]